MNNIIENYNGDNSNTFIFKLKYLNIFDEELFIELTNNIAKEVLKNDNYENKIKTIYILFNLYSYTSSAIVSNFDENDLYRITTSIKDFNIYLERFRNVINFYIEDDSLSVLEYIDEFGNFNIK